MSHGMLRNQYRTLIHQNIFPLIKLYLCKCVISDFLLYPYPMIVLILIVSLILICTITSRLNSHTSDRLISKVSIQTIVDKLFHSDDSSMRTSGIDMLRVTFVTLERISHNTHFLRVRLDYLYQIFKQCVTRYIINVNSYQYRR